MNATIARPTATITTASGKTHRVAALTEVIGNYYVTEGDADRGAFGAKARTACGRNYEGLVFPEGSTYRPCDKCAAAETPAAEVAPLEVVTLDGEELSVEVAATRAPRFAAVRAEGRYRVQDAATGGYVAVLASKAKAEERAAKMNAELSEVVYPVTPLLDENGHLPEFAEPLTEEEAEEVAVAILGPSAASTPAPRPADKLLTVWVGWTIVDLILPREADADEAVASVARKLAGKTPDGAKARTIRVTEAERAALSAIATEVETDAVTAGSGALARSARALRGRLSA